MKRIEAVCIFPEGTSVGKGLKPLKDGAAYFAVKNKIPIIPVALSGTEKIAKKFKKLQKTKIEIQFGPAIVPAAKDKPKQITKKIETALRSMLPNKYL